MNADLAVGNKQWIEQPLYKIKKIASDFSCIELNNFPFSSLQDDERNFQSDFSSYPNLKEQKKKENKTKQN